MATADLSKTQVYESMYLISLATQTGAPDAPGFGAVGWKQITYHLERLKAAHILAPKPTELRKMAANQLRAEITAAATMNLTSREMKDAYRQEKERLQLEKQLTKIKPKK